eukprot:s217_g30.t1
MHLASQFLDKLPGPLGKAVAEAGQVETGGSGRPHKAAEARRVLPIRSSAAAHYCQRLHEEVASWVVLLVEVLNFMYLGGKRIIGGEILNDAQRSALEMLILSVEDYLEEEKKVPPLGRLRSDLGRIRFDYSGEVVAVMEDINAASVIACWPKVGEAGIQPAERFVTDEVREWLKKPRSTILPRCYWPEKPPKSRVRATDDEWTAIVRAAVERNMMREVPEEGILRDDHGALILNGAGAVPKYKVIDGREVKLQRFISILVPANSYQDHMPGDDRHLPYLGQLSMLEVEEGQQLLVDSEDLTSLFSLPPEWSGMMTFAKQVPSSIFGGSPDQMSWVGMSVVPMGWINSVSLMQTVVRQLVFVESEIPYESEISKMKRFPEDPSASLVYLDSYDEIRKIDATYRDLLEGEESERHRRFTATCKKFGLSLNTGKRLVGAVKGSLQGGVLDGEKGVFHSAPEKQATLIGYGLMLLSQEEVSEFELRHFAGKALFNMAFRRPAMSLFEHIFYDIEKLCKERGPGPMSTATKSEVMAVLALTPLLRMNLRAKMDPEITITDASPQGAGGGVATTFKREPDTEDYDGETCLYCSKVLEAAKYPCPADCKAQLCSLECMWRHRGMDCKRRVYPVAKFGERFSGPHYPLSEAVGQVGLIEVQPPYDLTLCHNFFSDDGRSRLEELENDPDLFAEHYAPCCKLFSRARGRPLTLDSGERIQGKDCNLEHPYNSWVWQWHQATELEEDYGYEYGIGSMCCFGGRREKWFALLGNSPDIKGHVHKENYPGHDNLLRYGARRDDTGRVIYDTEEEAEYPFGWCQAYAAGLTSAVERAGRHTEAVYEGRKAWVMQELQESTQRLKEETTVVRLERAMKSGSEMEHLKEMLKRLTIRGSEVKLLMQENSDGEVPYPAYRWLFHKVFSFKWHDTGIHINEGELNAFLAMAERRASNPKQHSTRYLAILDSQVIRGALGKGRSTSRSLNRGLRRNAALMMISDCYPLLAWTISRWNWADTPSRVGVDKAGEEKEIRQKEAEAKAEKERKKAEAVAKHTGKKASQRAARRQKRLKEGKMQQTDKDLEELLQTKDEVVCALEDVQDEAELRKKFPAEGTAGYGSEYFSSSRYKFRYLLTKDGTPVAQIYKWP